jgi:hypothetical protein
VVTTATAPADSASSATSLPLLASVEQITVGIGAVAICWRGKVRASMPGISMSSSTTSGSSRAMAAAASSGFGALPASSRSGTPCSRCCIVRRTIAESSITQALTGMPRSPLSGLPRTGTAAKQLTAPTAPTVRRGRPHGASAPCVPAGDGSLDATTAHPVIERPRP